MHCVSPACEKTASSAAFFAKRLLFFARCQKSLIQTCADQARGLLNERTNVHAAPFTVRSCVQKQKGEYTSEWDEAESRRPTDRRLFKAIADRQTVASEFVLETGFWEDNAPNEKSRKGSREVAPLNNVSKTPENRMRGTMEEWVPSATPDMVKKRDGAAGVFGFDEME